jgi:hypothetical protein
LARKNKHGGYGMKVKLLDFPSEKDWLAIKNATMTTIGKSVSTAPDDEWKYKILLSEHSPIRKLKFSWVWHDLPSWVSVHFVRHKVGIEHFVKTQRTDRTGIDRNNLLQGALVIHECEANAQTIMNISRKRLCLQASIETREAWGLLLSEIKKVEPILYSLCVPECVYRGGCPEFFSCGMMKTKKYNDLT